MSRILTSGLIMLINILNNVTTKKWEGKKKENVVKNRPIAKY